MAQRRDQDGADAETAATGEIDARIALGIVAKHDFAGADGFGGDAGVGLQTDAEIGSGAAGAGAADDFVPGTEGDGGSGGSGQMLGAFGDGADGGLKVEFGGMNFDFVGRGTARNPDAGCAALATRSWLRCASDGMRE